MPHDTHIDTHLHSGVVGFPTALATAVGLIVASSVVLTASTGMSVGGETFALAGLIALVMMLCQTTSFSEVAMILPTSGSIYDYISCGMGRFFAITGTLAAYFIVHMFAGTAETVMAGVMVGVNFPEMMTTAGGADLTWLVGVGMVLLFGMLNAFGITVYGWVEVMLAGGMWLTFVIFGVSGLVQTPVVPTEGLFGAAMTGPDWAALPSFIGMAMFMFVGCELVTPLVPEMRNARRNVPVSMALGVGMVALSMLLFGMSVIRMVENVPLDPQGTVHLLETPAVIPAYAEAIFGTFGRWWIALAVLLASASTLNTLIASIPRIFYGMALDGSLPKMFAYLHPRLKTPLAGIAVAAAIPAAYTAALQGDVDAILPLVLAAVCAWAVTYILVSLSVVSLRLLRPDLRRPYRSPLFPLPQIVSSVGMIIAILYITPPGMDPASIYGPFGVMMGLTAAYAFFWTLFVRKANPFALVRVETILEEEGIIPAESGDTVCDAQGVPAMRTV